jgi:hypothetical protein
VVVIWPACVIEIVPAHMQLQVLSEVRAGMPPTDTVEDPGDHGATIAGMHGWGVRTPRAAEVAAATCGFASEVHMPKVAMFVIGTMSWMVATG